MSKGARCPKCNAELPRKGQFCLECGLDLYAEGVRRAPSAWPLLVVGALIAAAAIAYLSTRPAIPKDPREDREVRALTKELFGLVAEKKFDDIVRRFYSPDTQAIETTAAELHDIVRGKGAQGWRNIQAVCLDRPKELDSLARKYPAEHSKYVVSLVGAMVFQDGPLHAIVPAYGAQRAEAFLAWYLGQAFEGADAAEAEIADLRWQEGPNGEPLRVAKIRYPVPPKPMPGVANPTTLPWHHLEGGQWVLTFGNQDHHLDEVLKFIQNVTLE